MKKIIMMILVITIGILLYQKEEYIIIPNESIRIRIVANSNSVSDLYTKKVLKSKLEDYLLSLTSDAKNIDEAREAINDNLTNIDHQITNAINENYNLDFGINYFPKKIYKGILYNEGYYESLVITLGSGIGDNWWCVLYPPLCLIEENKNIEDVEYKFLIKELLLG